MGTTTSPSTLLPDLLSAATEGDENARRRLFELLYDELKTLARTHLRRERVDHTLAPTALVHETFLRFFPAELRCRDRGQLFALVSQAMRRILIDSARRRNAQKRSRDRVPLDDDAVEGRPRDRYLMALDAALASLAESDPHLARVVELRFFGGYSVEETAEALEISAPTVKRRWRLAKAWLHREVGEDGSE